jgi:peptide/nickel transport system permease protein
MWTFILRRLLLMIPTLIAVSMISYAIIELPPGDYMDAYVDRLIQQQRAVDPSEIAALRARYGLDDSTFVRYIRWMGNMLQGDLGRSLEWNQPVAKLVLIGFPGA